MFSNDIDIIDKKIEELIKDKYEYEFESQDDLIKKVDELREIRS